MDVLLVSDFPLYAIGSSVYRQNHISPLFVAPNEHIAADLANRLNAHQFSRVDRDIGVD